MLKILNEEEEGSAYCFFGANQRDAARLVRHVIKSLGLIDYFCFGGDGEIVCLRNKCRIRFFSPGVERYKIKTMAGLKVAWFQIDDGFSEEDFFTLNPLFRNSESKIVFSFSTYVGSPFQDEWFYDNYLRTLPEGSICIL